MIGRTSVNRRSARPGQQRTSSQGSFVPVINGVWCIPDKAMGNPAPFIKTVGGHRRPMIKKSETAWANGPLHQLNIARGIAMDVEQSAVETTGAANEALQVLKSSLDRFRSTIANDLTSIKAASSKVQAETLQMKQAYMAAQSILTSPEFERAVANAERLAVALESISRLSETRIKVAVFGGE